MNKCYSKYMLIKCPECHKEISDKASSCPHCGYPLKKKPQEDKSLIKIASRGSRGYQSFVMGFAITLAALGVTLLVALFFLFIYDYDPLIRTIIAIISQIFLGIGVYITIYLSMTLYKNRHIDKDIVYYDKKNEEFVFYTIGDRELRIKKNESFKLYNNAKNLGELRLRKEKGRGIFLGFTYDRIEDIRSKVEQYREL